MKPLFERIALKESKRSIYIFEMKEKVFGPFWHYHPEIELTLIIRGSGIRFVGDHVDNYGSNDLVLIGSNLPHQWISSQQEEFKKQDAIVIQFKKELFTGIQEFNAINQLIKQAELGIYFPKVSEALLQAISVIMKLDAALRISELVKILHLLSKAKKTFLSKSTKFNLKDTPKEQARINKTINYIIENMNKPLTVSEMAYYSNMVPQSFCRWFKKHTGHSFVSYLNQVRIQSACQYLASTDLPIKRIAYSVGFENVSHFNRTFKKIQGIAPSKFKQRLGS